jgi:DNA-binding response OmpR family regulator
MSKKILVIEDDKFLRKIIKRKLISENYEVVEALTGLEGLELARKKVDLILLDLILPEMDGFEVLSKLKSDSETSNIPVIIISNLGEADQIEKGLKLGANDYMIKAHFTPGEIVERVGKLL